MNKWLLPIISLLGNLLFYGTWLYCYLSFADHNERVVAFMRYFPESVSISLVSSILILVTIVSFVLVLKTKAVSWVRLTFVFIQTVFLALLIMQLF